MGKGLANYSRVRILTDRFATEGAPRGSIGFVIEIWEEGVYEVEVPDVTGASIAEFVATDADLELVDRDGRPKSAGRP